MRKKRKEYKERNNRGLEHERSVYVSVGGGGKYKKLQHGQQSFIILYMIGGESKAKRITKTRNTQIKDRQNLLRGHTI